jgi:hypothetical protein
MPDVPRLPGDVTYNVAVSEETRLLQAIDQRLSRIEDKLARAEMTFAGFLAGPGKRLMKLFGGGDLCAPPR